MPPLDKWEFGCRFGTAIHGGRFAQLNAPRAEFNFCCRPATGGKMAPEPCQHPNRVKGVVELDFARQDDSGDPIYTAPVSVGVCGWVRRAWLIGGATAMGFGIWSMHFTGMLAFRLPVLVSYSWPTVLLSLLVAISASAFALYVVSRHELGMIRALAGSVIMGSGIAAMHYIGMAAMRLAAVFRFHPLLVTLSVAFAIAFSFAALILVFDLREATKGTPSR